MAFPNWPPAYYILLGEWTNSFGGTLFADRLFSLFVGLMAVSVMYRLGKQMHSVRLGLVAAILMGTSTFFVYYLHELRAYSLYVLAVTVNAWFYWRLYQNPNAGRGVAISFVFSLALSLYTHYLAALCVLAIAAYHILFARSDLSRSHWLRILRLGVNGCLLFTPWIIIAAITVIQEASDSRSEPLLSMLYYIAFGYSNGLVWLLVAGLLTLRWWRNRAVRFIWVWLVMFMTLLILSNGYADFLFHPRHAIGLLPMIVLLIAFLVYLIGQWQPALSMLLLGIWIGAGIVYSLNPLPFMERIPNHLAGIATTANETLVEISQTCVAPTNFALYGISRTEQAAHFDEPLLYYLDGVDYPYGHVASIVADVDYHSTLFPEIFPDEFYELSPSVRLEQTVEAVDNIWIFTLPELQIQNDLLTLNQLLHDEGFMYCGAVVDRPDILATVYTRDASLCEQVITTCSGN
jgi:hypothetical protein